MTTSPHKTAALGQRHGAVNWTFSSAALRRAVGAYVNTDLGSECMQTDTSPPTFWKLLSIASPGPSATPTWGRVDSGPEVTATGPLVIMAGHIRFGFSGDVGLSTTAWTDQGPNNRNLSGTCAVAAAALGGKNCMSTNGTTHSMSATFATPAPGTSPTYLWVIARNDTNTNGFAEVVSLEGSNGMSIVRDTGAGEICLTTPGLSIRHVGGFTSGAFKRIRAAFTNSASDLLQVGSGSAVNGAPSANTAGNGLYLGTSNGTAAINTYAEIWAFDQDPGSTNLAALDAWASAKYGTSFP